MKKNRPMTKPKNNFMEILNKSIDDTIRGILGDGVSAIYTHMKYHGIDSNRLGEDPEAFEKAMTEIFKAGWRVFRRAILSSFCERLNLSMDKFAEHTFAQCMAIAEIEFLAKNKTSTDLTKVINNEQNYEFKVENDGILKLSLPEVTLGGMVKSCKLCGNNIDMENQNREQLLAELCSQCWELQNTVWDSPAAEAYVSTEGKYKERG